MKKILLPLLMVVSLNGLTQQDTTILISAAVTTENAAFEQEIPAPEESTPVYTIKKNGHLPLTIVGALWSGYAFTKIYSKDPSTTAQILALDKEDIPGFDRFGADVYHEKAATTSDLFFYGSMPLPLVLMFDKDIRKDAGRVAFMYLESMAITGLLYTSSVYFIDRYRPYAYNPNVPMGERTGGGAKNSFFAGHVALVGTSTFFVAKVFSDYHPNSPWNYFFYPFAVVSTAGTAYLRHRGGKHFLSDIILGTAVGTLSGLLVPSFHKNKNPETAKFRLSPSFDGQTTGVRMTYRF